MTTYKQLQESWIRSEWIQSGANDFGEDAIVIIPEGLVAVTLQDIVDINVTNTNYRDIVKLADYIMVENVDPIVDEIVRVTNNVHVVYEFEQFYRLSERLKPLTEEELKTQLNEFNETNMEMFYKYGHSSFWNVSKITDMSWLFCKSKFNGDISRWDVSNVTDMSDMFHDSTFHGDISRWDVSNVRDMSWMFGNSEFNLDFTEFKPNFNGDISQWNVSNVSDMSWMFGSSKFNGDISKWNVSNVTNMEGMFAGSSFNGDISRWNVSNVISMEDMFYKSNFNGDFPGGIYPM